MIDYCQIYITILPMNTILQTDEFRSWFKRLRDAKAKIAIGRRIERAEDGNFGDCKAVGDGVMEMRIHQGAGYRIYYSQQCSVIYILLVGGDKSSQQKDIENAKRLWKEIQGR